MYTLGITIIFNQLISLPISYHSYIDLIPSLLAMILCMFCLHNYTGIELSLIAQSPYCLSFFKCMAFCVTVLIMLLALSQNSFLFMLV